MNGGIARPRPQAPRLHILAQLEAERRQAVGCYEYERAAQIEKQMAQIAAASQPASPARETTAASQPKETTARKSAARKETK